MYNGHSDVTKLLNSSGDILASYYYDAFGNILEETGSIDNPYRYSGYEYDSETGKYYLKARMYDPVTARFMQEDTYRGKDEDPLSLNLYTYCHNNPIEYYDPTGHWIVHVAKAVAGAVIGATINLLGDIADDGKINRGAKSYLKAAGVGALVGATLGYGYGAYVMNAVTMVAGMTAFGMADSLIGDIIYRGGDINVKKAINEGLEQGASEAGSQIFQYAMEEVIIPKAKTVFKEVTANLKKQATQEAKAAIKNVSKIVSAAKANSKNMFGGLKNTAPKVPSSLPSGNPQGSKISLDKGTQSKLAERGMDLQLFGNKKGNSNVGGSAIEGVREADNIPGRGYHKEVYANKPVKVTDAVNKWGEFLGPGEYTDIHPRTGLKDPDRIFSADGKRSIRFGSHEMNSKPTKFHYHEEIWTYDPIDNVINVDNTVVRVPYKK